MNPNRRSIASTLALSLLAGLLSACTSAGEPASTPTPAPTPVEGSPPKIIGDAVEGSCDDKAAEAFVGQAGSDDVANRAREAAGAKGVRIIRPGMAVTMDYRAGRLNLHLDDADRITRVTCG